MHQLVVKYNYLQCETYSFSAFLKKKSWSRVTAVHHTYLFTSYPCTGGFSGVGRKSENPEEPRHYDLHTDKNLNLHRNPELQSWSSSREFLHTECDGSFTVGMICPYKSHPHRSHIHIYSIKARL